MVFEYHDPKSHSTDTDRRWQQIQSRIANLFFHLSRGGFGHLAAEPFKDFHPRLILLHHQLILQKI